MSQDAMGSDDVDTASLHPHNELQEKDASFLCDFFKYT